MSTFRPSVVVARSLILAAVLCGATASVAAAPPADATVPDHYFGPGPLHKVLVDADDAAAAQALRASGAVRLEIDDDSFELFIVDERAFGGAAALASSGLSVVDEQSLIPANGWLLDGSRPGELLAALDPAERLGDVAGPQGGTAGGVAGAGPIQASAGLYLVQFVGPVRDEWLSDLAAVGADVVQFVAMNGYVVALAPDAVPALQAFRDGSPIVQFAGPWQPAFRLSPVVRAAAQAAAAGVAGAHAPLSVTVQLVDGPGAETTLDELGRLGRVELVDHVGPYVDVSALLDPGLFRALAREPSVFAIEERGVRALRDERQGQTTAGNVNATGPTAPGYLAWLASKGFDGSQFGTFAVNVADDALTLAGHPDLPGSRIAFTQNPTNQAGVQGGHGFLNANIIAGFNSGTGSSLEDSGGYNYGLGIAPFARVGSTSIFGSGSSSPAEWENTACSLGARISSNSWGENAAGGGPLARYDSTAQAYDYIVRDARPAGTGNQEYAVIFAAGNDGPGSNTVSSPGTAKNVLTVGATENNRQTGTDGCGIANSGANNINDLIDFSSHGPVNASGGDGRWKPEIVAPGTHIEAGVPQANYDGSSVCDKYWPAGQTLYGWSSGTSHSTPCVAGGAALVRQWFLNQGLAAPSPAMIKALLVNSASYCTGAFANDTLPSNGQGMGRMDLGRTFDGAPRLLFDETQVLASTGASWTQSGTVADAGQPLRVTLVWTDAPGALTGAPWVNDLDLTVTSGASTWKGNVFSGAFSVTGGSADIRNNTESVFLPPGTVSSFTVKVAAASIGGDGVPGNGDTTDQDFALVVSNATASGPAAPAANFGVSPASGAKPLSVNFTDQSTGSITSWAWSFGDGATSTAHNPVHTYTTAGSFTVKLTVTGAGGTSTKSKPAAVKVTNTAPPPGSLQDGSFEHQVAGAAPAAPWSIKFGTAHVIDPAGVTSDKGMPTDGTHWAEIAADGTNDATPPSNPGGVTNPPVGGAGIAQSFTWIPGSTRLAFDAAFLRNEAASDPVYNDWMSVDISDGSQTVNLFYKDTFSSTSGTSVKYGYPITAIKAVSKDLAKLFPSATDSTVFTLTALVGNGGDDQQPSKGYLDNVRLVSTTKTGVPGTTLPGP